MTIIYFFILCIIIYRITPNNKQILAATIISLLMSILAFYLTETNQYDLIAHRGLYDTLLDGGVSSAMTYSMVDKSPLYIWFIYVLTFLGDNKYTSAIPTFIGYFILVFLLIKTSQKYKVKRNLQLVFFAFLLFIIPWHDYSAGIRGALSFSLCCLGVYFEFRQKNKLLGGLLYVAPILIHQASVIFLVLRILIFLIKIFPSTKKIIYLMCLLLGTITNFLNKFINEIANITGLRIFSIISNSFNSYTQNENAIYEISVVMLRVSAILLIYFITRKNIKNETEAETNIYLMYTMLMLISIGFIWQYDIVCRYTVACMIFSPLILYKCKPKYAPIIIIFAIINLIRYYYSYYSNWEILF